MGSSSQLPSLDKRFLTRQKSQLQRIKYNRAASHAGSPPIFPGGFLSANTAPAPFCGCRCCHPCRCVSVPQPARGVPGASENPPLSEAQSRLSWASGVPARQKDFWLFAVVELLRVFGITPSTSSGRSADELGATGVLPSCRRISPGQGVLAPGHTAADTGSRAQGSAGHVSPGPWPLAGGLRSRPPGGSRGAAQAEGLAEGAQGFGALPPVPAREPPRGSSAADTPPVRSHSVSRTCTCSRRVVRVCGSTPPSGPGPRGVPCPPRHLASRALLHPRSRRRLGRSREGQPPHPASPAAPALPSLRPRRVTCPRPLAPGARVAPP